MQMNLDFERKLWFDSGLLGQLSLSNCFVVSGFDRLVCYTLMPI
jgi:hypothetical protein